MSPYSVMKTNAIYFDNIFIQKKEKIISCDSRSIISDYLVLKANITPKLRIGVIAYGGNISPLIQQMYDRIMEIPDYENNFDCQLKAQHILKFTHDTKIYFLRDEHCDIDLRGIGLDLCYLTKCASINTTHMLTIITSLSYPHSRLIKHSV